MARKYSSLSQETTLVSAITTSDLTMTVLSASSVLGGVTLPATAGADSITLVIDPDTANEEIVNATAKNINVLTIVRSIDSSIAKDHAAGAKVRHMAIGLDFRNASEHIEGGLAQHAATTSAELRGVISDETGTGSLVFAISPTLVTPTLGVATATSINGTTIPTSATLVKTSDTGTVTSTMILDGTIVNADVNASAAIAATKISGTAVTQADTGTVTSTMIADGTIVNGDISASAAVAYSKLALTGAIVSTDIANDTIVNADINTAAAIDWTKLAISSTVSATELGYVDGVTSSIQTQLDSKLPTATAASTYAPLASPALTGVPTAPTAAANTNTTQIATTAYVQTELTDLINGAPGALDTLNELATALGNDANYSTTISTALSQKLPKTGGTMVGAIDMGGYKVTNLATPTVSTDAATKGYIDTAVIAPTNLTGPITSVGNATAIASQTGTGTKFVMDTSPIIVTPTITGSIIATGSINGTTIPTSKTLVTTTDKLSVHAATTSLELAGVISDETGTGSLVFATSPTLVTPALGTPSSVTLTNATGLSLTSGVTGTLPVANGGTGVTTSTGTGANVLGTSPTLTTPVISSIVNTGTLTLPTSTDTLVGRATTDTLTNKTISAGVLTGTVTAGGGVGTAGQVLSSTGTGVQWIAAPSGLPSQTGNSGKYLTTDGSTASWAAITTDPNPSIFMLMGA